MGLRSHARNGEGMIRPRQCRSRCDRVQDRWNCACLPNWRTNRTAISSSKEPSRSRHRCSVTHLEPKCHSVATGYTICWSDDTDYGVEPVTIAVIIPAYNSELYLASAIDSVLCQTLTDWKLIVVVDGGEDATEEIAMSYAGRDRRIRVVNQTHRGANAARIRGLSEIGNETTKIAFLDADDVYEPHALDLLCRTLEQNPSASAAHGLARYIDGHGMPIHESEAERIGRHRWGLRGILPTKIPTSEHTTFTNLAFYNVIHTFGQVLIRMGALEKVGSLDPSWPMVADWELWIRLSRAGYIAFVDSVVLNYRRHENNMSNQWQSLWHESWKLRRSLISSSQLSLRERYIMATAAAYYPVLTYLRLAADSARQRRFADVCTYLKHCAASYYRMARWVTTARG